MRVTEGERNFRAKFGSKGEISPSLGPQKQIVAGPLSKTGHPPLPFSLS